VEGNVGAAEAAAASSDEWLLAVIDTSAAANAQLQVPLTNH
jgi:hypothetical protein